MASHMTKTPVAGRVPATGRIAAFDVAKLVAVVAVIAGHTAIRFIDQPAAPFVLGLTFSFHLPLFFIVSGYFMHTDRPFGLVRNLRSLAVPYAVTAAAVVALATLAAFVLKDMGSSRVVLKQWANAAVFAAGDLVSTPLWPQQLRIGAIWFLPALFWARLVVWGAYKTPRPALVVAASFAVGYFTRKLCFLPLSIQPGLCAALFVYAGARVRRLRLLEPGAISRGAWALLAGVWVCAVWSYNGFGMAVCDYGVYAADALRNVCGGIAATLIVLVACLRAEARLAGSSLWRLVGALGRYSLVIMCVHLVEDDVLRWGLIVGQVSELVGGTFGWLGFMVLRVAADVLIAALLVRIPLVARAFGVAGSAGRSKAAKDTGEVRADA